MGWSLKRHQKTCSLPTVTSWFQSGCQSLAKTSIKAWRSSEPKCRPFAHLSLLLNTRLMNLKIKKIFKTKYNGEICKSWRTTLSMTASGLGIRNRGRGCRFFRMEGYMRGIGGVGLKTARVGLSTSMAASLRASSKTEEQTGMERILTPMVPNTPVNGCRTSNTVKERR